MGHAMMSTITPKALQRLKVMLEQAIVRFSEIYAVVPNEDPLADQVHELIEKIEEVYALVVDREP
jgi:hypothetical protein